MINFGKIIFVDPKIKATVRKHLLSVGDGTVDTRCGSVLGGGLGNNNKSNHLNNSLRPEPAVHYHHHLHHQSHARTNGSCPEQEPLLEDDCDENERLQWEPLAANSQNYSGNGSGHKSSRQPKFEAYMMTGEHILNISRMPQSTSIIPKQQKKVCGYLFYFLILDE